MRLLKFLIFYVFFRKFFKDSKRSPSIFWNFATEWMLKKSLRAPAPLLQLSALWDFSRGIIFVLKLGFLRPSTLYLVFKDRCFFYVTSYKNWSLRSPSPQFLQETKHFANVKDSSMFSALCDIPETFIKIFEKFFLQFSVFEKFSVRKNGFFAVSSWGRFVLETYAYPFGYFLAL